MMIILPTRDLSISKSEYPSDSTVIPAPITLSNDLTSSLFIAFSKVLFSVLRDLPLSGSTACVRPSRALTTFLPAESPSTRKSSTSLYFLSSKALQEVSFSGITGLLIALLISRIFDSSSLEASRT